MPAGMDKNTSYKYEENVRNSMNDCVLLSVIMSVYNEEKFVGDAVESILNQSYSNFEFIIIDDASTDRSVSIIEKYADARIRLIKNSKNQGLTKNLNKGIQLSKGKYILRMDADDIAFSNRFALQVKYMEEHLEVVLSGGFMKTFGDTNEVFRCATENDLMKINLMFNTVSFHPTFIIRRDSLEKNKIGYNENLRYAQDYYLIYELSKIGKIANIPEILIRYRVHSGQVSNEKKYEQKKCADFTRRCILEELDIKLSDEKMEYWTKFCLLDYHPITDSEREKLVEVKNRIINNNSVKEVYSPKILKEVLEQRMREYMHVAETEMRNVRSDDMNSKYFSLFKLMGQWVRVLQQGKSVADYFEPQKNYEIAVYGLGEVGEILIEELKGSNIKVIYGIDRKACTIFSDIKVVSPEDVLKKVDMIVVTAISYFDIIKEMLEKKVDYPIVSLGEILDALEYSER